MRDVLNRGELPSISVGRRGVGGDPSMICDCCGPRMIGSPAELGIGLEGFMTGMVKWFNNRKGWGFIVPNGPAVGGGKDLFVHHTAILSLDRFKSLYVGQRVSFEVETNATGPRAVDVRVIPTASAVGAPEQSA